MGPPRGAGDRQADHAGRGGPRPRGLLPPVVMHSSRLVIPAAVQSGTMRAAGPALRPAVPDRASWAWPGLQGAPCPAGPRAWRLAAYGG